MAVAAEVLLATPEPTIHNQEYARSLLAIWKLGRCVVEATVEPEYLDPTYEAALADFTTATAEMLKTDEEFRDVLDIDNVRSHQVIDDKVYGSNGEAMVDMIGQGLQQSVQMALEYPEYQSQATRDYYDLRNAERVDELPAGMSRIVVSMEPKTALKDFREVYTKLGYKDGLVYVQSYTRVDDETVIAASHSVDMSDEAVWRELFAELGVEVPVNESPDAWLQHALEIEATAEEARDFVLSLRAKYYQRVGNTNSRSSVTEYVAAHTDILNQIFSLYYPALGEAVYTGRNNPVIKEFAQAMLQTNVKPLAAEVRSELMRIANSNTFDNESGKLMDSIIRYAAVEQLRKGLVEAKVTAQAASLAPANFIGTVQPIEYRLAPGQLHQMMALNVETGVVAQRSYGGCSGQIKLDSTETFNPFNDFVRMNSPQEAYGGKENQAENSKSGKIRCIQCREYVAKADVIKKDCWECPKCKHKVDICTGDILNQGQAENGDDTKTNVVELFQNRAHKRTTAIRPRTFKVDQDI